jgi:hypothetical protein
MNSKKMFYVMIFMLLLSIASVGGITYTGNKFMTEQSKKLSELKIESKIIEQQAASLRKANTDIQQYSELNNIAKQIVPQDKDQARSVREIYEIAKEQNIKISSITFPSSDLGSTQKNKQPATSATPAAPSPQSTSKITQAEAVPDIPGVFKIQTNVVIDSKSPVSYSQMIAFLERLENNRRTAQVSNITIQPNSLDRSIISFSLSLLMYTKP